MPRCCCCCWLVLSIGLRTGSAEYLCPPTDHWNVAADLCDPIKAMSATEVVVKEDGYELSGAFTSVCSGDLSQCHQSCCNKIVEVFSSGKNGATEGQCEESESYVESVLKAQLQEQPPCTPFYIDEDGPLSFRSLEDCYLASNNLSATSELLRFFGDKGERSEIRTRGF